MKHLLKSSLAVLLVVIMCFSCVLPAFAAEDGDVHAHAGDCKGTKHTLENCPEATAVEVVPSQCGEWGYTLYACPDCGDYFAADFNKKDGNHDMNETAAAVAPTCTEPGKTAVMTCQNCGMTEGGTTVPALDHDWNETGRDGDCLTKGYIYEKCKVCGEERQIEIDVTGKGHIWSEHPVKIEKEPTWNENGIAVYECTVCKITKEVKIIAEHDHKLTAHAAKDATCTEDGSIAYWECTVCGVYFADENATTEVEKKDGNYVTAIPKLGHITEGDGIVVKQTLPATCSEEGWKKVICGRCEQEVTVTIPAIGHTFEDDKPITIAPTCVAFGFDVYACTVCGYVKRTNAVSPLGHTTWDAQEDRKLSTNKNETAANCTTAGSRTWDCGDCGEAQSSTLPATGHKEASVTVNATCAKYGYEFVYCTNANCPLEKVSLYVYNGVSYNVTVDGAAVALISCNVGTAYDPNQHNIENGIINESTCTEAGDKVGYCVDCNKYKTEVIPAKGHNFDQTVASNVSIKQKQDCEHGEILTVKCTRCDATTDITTANTALDHQYPATGTTVAPTCVSDGYTLFTCGRCEKEVKQNEVKWVPRDEYTLEQAKAEHPGFTELSDKVFRQGDCIIIGLYKHYCSSCGEYVLVVIDGTGNGHVDPKTYEGEGEHAAVAPTCTEKGATAAFTCKVCKNFIESTEVPALGHKMKHHEKVNAECEKAGTIEYWSCSRCNKYFEDVDGRTEVEKDENDNYVIAIPATGHDLEIIPEVKATCDKAGVSEYKACKNCDYEEGKTTIPAINHANIEVVDSDVVSCVTYGYKHWLCPDCGEYEFIDGYKLATGHNMVDDEDNSYDATCTVDGVAAQKCTNKNGNGVACNHTTTAVIPATGHKNENGAIIDDCQDTNEDRHCDNCNTDVPMSHNAIVIVKVPATCKDYGYDLEVCTACEPKWNRVTNVDDSYLADHTWGDWYVKVEATFTEKGTMERECSVCHTTETKEYSKVGVEFKLDIDNAVVSGAGYADSSRVTVTVKLDSAKVDVWGLQFDLIYDDDVLDFVSAEFVSEVFTTSPLYNDRGGCVSIIANVPNKLDEESGEPITQNTTIEGEQDFVVLTFCVNNPTATKADFSFKNELVLKNDSTEVESAGRPESIKIERFMDVNGDGDVNLADALDVYKMVIGEVDLVYDVTVDIDKDGKVTLADFVALYEYIVGIKSYEDMVNLEA